MNKIPTRRWRTKSARKQRRIRHRPINVLASALTTAGLYCGISSIFASIDMEYESAAYWILAAIVFDMLDGTVAKLTHSTSEFGKELDSLCDLVSFGAAPATLIYTAYLAEARAGGAMSGRTGAVIAIIYVVCGALRLARYNVYQSEVRDFFIGLPIPAAAGTVATFALFTHYLDVHVATWVLSPLTLLLAYLMVSVLRYPKDKMKDMILRPKHAFRTLVCFGFLIALFDKARGDYSPAIILFPLGALYCSLGIVDAVYKCFRRKTASKDEERKDETQEESPSPEAPLVEDSVPKTEERL